MLTNLKRSNRLILLAFSTFFYLVGFVQFNLGGIHYLMEGFGLFIFMISACFFSVLLEQSNCKAALPNPKIRALVMAVAMATTALFIFVSPLTRASGAFINPSVSLMRWRLGQLSFKKMIGYCVSQTLGGLMGVYVMVFLMGEKLTHPPVNCVVTVPARGVSLYSVVFMEFITSFVMISMVLFLSDTKLKKSIPYFAALLVGVYVIVAGPVSGFGMNPARTLASAIPAAIYTDFWVYMLCPTFGMLLAAELYLFLKKKKTNS